MNLTVEYIQQLVDLRKQLYDLKEDELEPFANKSFERLVLNQNIRDILPEVLELLKENTLLKQEKDVAEQMLEAVIIGTYVDCPPNKTIKLTGKLKDEAHE